MACTSVASVFPQELFMVMLSFVGDERILSGHKGAINPTARREEMQHLSACTLTCLDWARRCRKRMFNTLVLRSLDDVATLELFSQTSPSDRLPSIITYLAHLVTEQKVGEAVWLDKCYQIVESYHALEGLPDNFTLDIRASGHCPVTTNLHTGESCTVMPAFLFSETCIRIPCPQNGIRRTRIFLENVHVVDLRGLLHLLHCLKVWSADVGEVHCYNVTWDRGLRDTHYVSTFISQHFRTYRIAPPTVSGCTDDVLAALCVSSKLRRFPVQSMSLDMPTLKKICPNECETIMRTMLTLHKNAERSGVFQHCEVLLHGTNQQTISLVQERFGRFGDQHRFIPNGSFTFSVGESSPVLSARRPCTFTYLAYSEPPRDDGVKARIRHVLVEIHPTAVAASLRAYDWSALFQHLRTFPDLNCIAISCKERKHLSAFVDGLRLGDSDGPIHQLLQLWYEESPDRWTQDYLDVHPSS